MKLKITLSTNVPGVIDFNYQHQIASIIYKCLANTNPDYAEWLHDQGFAGSNGKQFKLFVFSGITFEGPIKISAYGAKKGFTFRATERSPFTLSFQIASPVDEFVQTLIEGVFFEGNPINLGRQPVRIFRVQTLHDNLIAENGSQTVNLAPLETPIFVKKPMPKGVNDLFLYPGDDEYEILLNRNLANKYQALFNKSYEGEPLNFRFKPLAKKSEKKFTIFKQTPDGASEAIDIKGTLKPFGVTGPLELIKIGIECGFGQENSMGCGYVDVVKSG